MYTYSIRKHCLATRSEGNFSFSMVPILACKTCHSNKNKRAIGPKFEMQSVQRSSSRSALRSRFLEKFQRHIFDKLYHKPQANCVLHVEATSDHSTPATIDGVATVDFSCVRIFLSVCCMAYGYACVFLQFEMSAELNRKKAYTAERVLSANGPRVVLHWHSKKNLNIAQSTAYQTWIHTKTRSESIASWNHLN